MRGGITKIWNVELSEISWTELFGPGLDVPDPRGNTIDIDYEEVQPLQLNPGE